MLEYQQKQKIFRKIYTTYTVIQHNVYIKSLINVETQRIIAYFYQSIKDVYIRIYQTFIQKLYKHWNINKNKRFLGKYTQRI